MSYVMMVVRELTWLNNFKLGVIYEIIFFSSDRVPTVFNNFDWFDVFYYWKPIFNSLLVGTHYLFQFSIHLVLFGLVPRLKLPKLILLIKLLTILLIILFWFNINNGKCWHNIGALVKCYYWKYKLILYQVGISKIISKIFFHNGTFIVTCSQFLV